MKVQEDFTARCGAAAATTLFLEHKAASAMARGETDGTPLLRSLQLRYYYSPAIFSGRNTSSKRSAVRKPRATQASFREMFSAKAFFAVFAAFSYPM